MKPEWIPLFLILGFLCFQLILKLTYPVWVLLHELGHALPALLSRKNNVRVDIGEGPLLWNSTLCGLCFNLHRHHLSRGSTSYDGSPGSWSEACFIILPAPILSLVIAAIYAGLIYRHASGMHPVVLLILTAAWLANFHIAFSAWWPIGNPRSDLHALSKRPWRD